MKINTWVDVCLTMMEWLTDKYRREVYPDITPPDVEYIWKASQICSLLSKTTPPDRVSNGPNGEIVVSWINKSKQREYLFQIWEDGDVEVLGIVNCKVYYRQPLELNRVEEQLQEARDIAVISLGEI